MRLMFLPLDRRRAFMISRTSTGISHGGYIQSGGILNVRNCGDPCADAWWTQWHKHCFVYHRRKFTVRRLKGFWYTCSYFSRKECHQNMYKNFLKLYDYRF